MPTDSGQDMKSALPLELARRLEGKSPQFGRTVFVKLAYLLQEVYQVPLGYRFSLYTYGPYSTEVLADLDRARLRGQVNVDYIGQDAGFVITKGPRAGQPGPDHESLNLFEGEIDSLIECFGQYNARSLELRTTIAYVWKMLKVSGRADESNVVGAILQLKPQFKDSEIKAAISELKENGLLPYHG